MSTGLAERLASRAARARIVSVVDGAKIERSFPDVMNAAERPLSIAISLPHGPAFLTSLVATWIGGNTIAPISRRATVAELRGLLALLQPSAILCDPADTRFESLGYRKAARAATPALLIGGAQEDGALRLTAGDAWLATTSGTTGVPKVAVIGEDAILENCRGVADYLELSADDRVLAFTPTHFTYAVVQLLSAALCGATLLAWPHGLGVPAALADFARDSRMSGVSANPTALELLVPAFRSSYDGARYVLSAGQPLQLRLTNALERVFPAARTHSGYGCTENTNRMSFAAAEPGLFREGIASVGWPIPGTELRIEPRSGEIVVSGTSLMAGYLQDLLDGASRITEFATGDLGVRGERGELYLTGRRRNRINVGNEMVDPEEVENALRQVAGVLECAVGALDDALLGEAIGALIVVEKTDIDLRAALAPILRPSRWPHHVAPVSRAEIPRTEYGKVDRVGLKSALAEHFGPVGGRKRKTTRL